MDPWNGCKWFWMARRVVLVVLPSCISSHKRTPKRPKKRCAIKKLTDVESAWISPSPNGLTRPLPESTWADPHILTVEVGVDREVAAIVAIMEGVVEEEGIEAATEVTDDPHRLIIEVVAVEVAVVDGIIDPDHGPTHPVDTGITITKSGINVDDHPTNFASMSLGRTETVSQFRMF